MMTLEKINSKMLGRYRRTTFHRLRRSERSEWLLFIWDSVRDGSDRIWLCIPCNPVNVQPVESIYPGGC